MKAFRDITISLDGLKTIEEEWCEHTSISVCSLVNYWSNRMNFQIIEGARMTGRLAYGYVGDGWPEYMNQDYALERDSRNLKEAFVGDLHCRDIGDALYQANSILDVMPEDKRFIMDIGSGYGRLAIPFIYNWRQSNGEGSTYVGIDAVPVSLIIAPQFVAQAIDAYVRSHFQGIKLPVSEYEFVSLPSWKLDDVKGILFSAFITVHSFQEMTQPAVDAYVKFAHENHVEGAIFYSVNLWPTEDYVPSSWELVFDRAYPINRDGSFNERAWRIQ